MKGRMNNQYSFIDILWSQYYHSLQRTYRLETMKVIISIFIKQDSCFGVKCLKDKVYSYNVFKVIIMVPGQLTPNHLTPESSHTIFGQLTLYMK